MTELVGFIVNQLEDEWERLLKEFVQLSPEAMRWQPDPNIHSIGWHVRHVIEWRYALVHVMICGHPNQEKLYCLGGENEPVVRKLVANPGEWFEPRFSVQEDVEFGDRVRAISNADIASLPPARYSEEMEFPWRKNRVLDEIAEELRHSAMHRGQMKELRKAFSRRYSAAVK